MAFSSRINWVSQHQNGRTILNFNEARHDGVAVTSLQTDNQFHTPCCHVTSQQCGITV